LEARALRELLVKVAVADVEIAVSGKARPNIIQHVLGRHEVHLDAARRPEGTLRGRKPVGATADQKPEFLGPPHHLNGNAARRVTELERAINIKADQVCHGSLLLPLNAYESSSHAAPDPGRTRGG